MCEHAAETEMTWIIN